MHRSSNMNSILRDEQRYTPISMTQRASPAPAPANIEKATELRKPRFLPPSTVGRGKTVRLGTTPSQGIWQDEYVALYFGDSLTFYDTWTRPSAIVSDGGYGVLGFEGDTSDHLNLPQWYEPVMLPSKTGHLI
jgi:hypothetical protein